MEIKTDEHVNPIEILHSNGQYKMNYESKTIFIKEVPIKNLILPE